MRIGVVAQRAGVSSRMIRYHETHAHLPSRGRTRGGHRTSDEQDVRWLRNLQTPLTADAVQLPKSMRAKIIFYSRGLADPANPNQTRYPFNVDMNINHEYWHLRENDPNDPDRLDPITFSTNQPSGPSRIDIKFSFGNCLDDDNLIEATPPFRAGGVRREVGDGSVPGVASVGASPS